MSVFDRLLPRRQSSRNVPEETSLFDMRNDFHRAVDEMFRRAWMDPFGAADVGLAGFQPRIDVHEDEDNVYVKADLPGIDRKDLDIRLDRDAVVIRGEKRAERTTDERGVHRQERSYGAFLRRIPLPWEVDEGRCTADYKDGVLSITLPKSERSRSQARRIEVRGPGR